MGSCVVDGERDVQALKTNVENRIINASSFFILFQSHLAISPIDSLTDQKCGRILQ